MADPFKAYSTGSGKTVTQILEKYGARAGASLGTQLYKEGQGILASSQGLVPVDTTALKSSGYVTEPERKGDQLEVLIGYGGPAAQINIKTGESTDGYALYVHENLEAHHPVGTAKYLEMPFDQAKRGMGGRIAAGMRSDLGGGGTSSTATAEEGE
jgi:hypothetical protein